MFIHKWETETKALVLFCPIPIIIYSLPPKFKFGFQNNPIFTNPSQNEEHNRREEKSRFKNLFQNKSAEIPLYYKKLPLTERLSKKTKRKKGQKRRDGEDRFDYTEKKMRMEPFRYSYLYKAATPLSSSSLSGILSSPASTAAASASGSTWSHCSMGAHSALWRSFQSSA